MYRKKTHIHFVGIGGIGMSGIAAILKSQGYEISGCDADFDQPSIKILQALGCSIYRGNNTTACASDSIDVVVYSSAIKQNNAELMAARSRGIPTIARALMLAELMRTKHSIAITGSHGKTTTTSLISHILLEAKMDPTIIVGGHLQNLSSNACMGSGDYLVAEADESDRSFLHLFPTFAIVTNIDLEHLETYKDLDDIKATFIQFLGNLPFYGKAILCNDDPIVRSILPLTHVKTILYGLTPDSDIYACDVRLKSESSSFVVCKKDKILGEIYLPIPGKHNVLNCLAAISLSLELDLSFEVIKQGIGTFKGVDRRFSYRGNFHNAEIFDDYGHHPREIEVTALVAKKRSRGRFIMVFQPHRYSRTHKLWDLFLETFKNMPIDRLIITDIYPASEAPIDGVSSENLVQELNNMNLSYPVEYVPLDEEFSLIKDKLKEIVVPDDLILMQGAGKIYKLGQKLIIRP